MELEANDLLQQLLRRQKQLSARLQVRTQAVGLLETCDALRFSAVPPAVSGSLSQTAEETILALEAHS